MSSRISPAAGLALALAAVVTACSDYEVNRPGPDASAEPDILTDKQSLSLGEVARGDTATATLRVGNQGTAGLDISLVELEGTGSFEVAAAPQDARIEPGDFEVVEVSWSPLVPYDTAILLIHSDDPDTPVLEIPVEGWGLVPVLEVDPSPVEVGFNEDDCSAWEEVQLRNAGTAPLTLEALLVVGEGFEILDEGGAPGAVLEPDEAVSIRLGWTPSEEESEDSGEGELWVSSDDPRGEVITEVGVGGAGLEISTASGGIVRLEDVYGSCASTEVLRFDRANGCGMGRVVLEAVEIEGDVFELLSPATLPHTFGPEEPLELELGLASVSEDTYVERMLVTFEGAEEPLKFWLVAEVHGLALEALPSPLDLGEWPVGCEVEEPLGLYNPSQCELTVTGLDIADPAYGLSGAPDLPFTLEPHETVILDVARAVDAEGDLGSTLEVSSVEGGDEAVPITLSSGEGWVEDTFMRDGPYDELDIVFFIDGSCSMSDDQVRLTDQAGTYVDALDDLDIDWQIGVVGQDGGCFHADPITPDSGDPEGEFTEAVLEVYGWHVEWGLEATVDALDRAGSTGCNAGFLREDAGLRTIMVSDEPDQSSAAWDTWVTELQAIHEYARVSAIAGDYPSGCSTASAGHGYYEASVATSGQFLSICQADWSDSIDALVTELATDPDDPFPLSREPEESTIAVEVNGTTQTGWTYDAATNEVSFPAGVIVQGDIVVISYGLPCTGGVE